MKKILKISFSVLMMMLLYTCQDEDQEFGDVVAPTNLELTFEIVGQDAANPYGDGSGFVNFTASASKAITYRYDFGDGTGNILAPSGEKMHRFTQNGLNNYVVTVIASGTGGLTTSKSITLDVFSAFNPIEIKNKLTGGASSNKTWYWDASVMAHLGVGPLDDVAPIWYAASPFEKESVGCLYEDRLVFTQDASENVTLELNNNGNTYFHRFEVLDAIGQPNPNEDTCYPYDASGVKPVSFLPSSSGIDETISTQASFSVTNNGFMSYYLGNNEFEILSITETNLHVRVVQTEPSGFQLAWYLKFTTNDPYSNSADCSGDSGNTGTGDNSTLIWSDEFDVDGAPCAGNWAYDLGTGDGGWGNNEAQYYTDNSDNIIVENGLLKITAKAESFMGSNYTSARIKTQNLFDFQYGKVQVRAKLPTGGGTWPAIWMLGSNFDTVGWPACGEIDIMEHVGNDQNRIHSTLHYPGNSGGNGNGNSIVVPNVSTEFKIYEVTWSASTIEFKVDGTTIHTFTNNTNVPFNHNFFLILNVAMGGNFGGAIDSGFTQSTMEIDYVRVYQ